MDGEEVTIVHNRKRSARATMKRPDHQRRECASQHCASSHRGSDHIKSYDFRRLKAWLRPRWRHARCAGSRTTPTHTTAGAPTAHIKAAPHTPPTPACGGAVCIDWGSRDCHQPVLSGVAAWHRNLRKKGREKKTVHLHTCPGVPSCNSEV